MVMKVFFMVIPSTGRWHPAHPLGGRATELFRNWISPAIKGSIVAEKKFRRARMTKIGFIGLGRMGRPMAGNMQQKGFAMHVYDIVEEPVRTLVRAGASAADSVADVARSCRTIITVLPSHTEVEVVVLGPEGIVANAEPGTLVMDMSTVDPACTDRLAEGLAGAGMTFVDAPIGRLASHADRGESLFMVGPWAPRSITAAPRGPASAPSW
jgi:hypothetical protein